jgi:HEPN domain-containing protein
MNATVSEWIAKAEADRATAARELRATESPNYDAVCFHAEQAVEKLMKAMLIHLGVTPPRTHDLVVLDRLLAPVCPRWSWPDEELRLLSRAAIAFRYPGESADKEEASEVFETAERLCAQLHRIFETLG